MYERSPEFIKKHGIKRIIELRNTAYHQEKKVLPDSAQMTEFNIEGAKLFSTSYLENERYYWSKVTLDDENRCVKNERYNRDGLHGVSDFNYLPNGDYIQRFYSASNPERITFYKYFFDQKGNEIRREEWSKDSLVLNWETKTYNEYNLILSQKNQRRHGDATLSSVYRYKNDTLLVWKDFYSKGEFNMRTKYEYYPDGKKKATHFDKQSSWYSFYDDQGRLNKQMVVQSDKKDTAFNLMEYNEHGLIESVSYQRKNFQQRREVFTYEDNKEVSKTIHTQGDTFNSLLETVYLGDTAIVVYQTPYWKNRASYATYKRIDAHGNILLELGGEVRGKKQPLSRLMKDANPVKYQYTMSGTGKLLEKYKQVRGWPAEEAFCPTYSDDKIHDGLNRRKPKRKHFSCDTIKTRRYNGGKHYFVSLNSAPNLTRHIYENKSGVVDSILDITKAGITLNRMIKENGVRVSYSLLERKEYNKMDSIQRVFKCSGTRNYTLSENMIEEYFWKGDRKMKIKKFVNHWGGHSSNDVTTITFSYYANYRFETKVDPQGKITEERRTYDENKRLIQITELNRKSSGSIQVDFTYDENGNLLERSEVAVRKPHQTLYKYEFH